jgi:tRNA(Ile)-lysidine synthase
MLDRLTIERMLKWTGDKPVLIALSGGGDSVALLHLLVTELGAERFRAAVVDHALREGSAADAATACGFAEALGVKAEMLTLAWADGANHAQQAARQARYRALCDHARALGLNTIAAAHTADDQAETMLMRAARDTSWRGLAGIAPFAFAPLWPEGRGIALARPLLGARRAGLRAYVCERGGEWLEDPANANAAYERVRVRQRLAYFETGGFDPMRLALLAARLRLRADDLDRAALALINRAARPSDLIYVAHAEWAAPHEVRRRAFSVLMAAAAGAQAEPPTSDLIELERHVMSHGHRGSTHSGVEFMPAEGGVYFAREPGAVLGRADGAAALPALPLSEGKEAVWDGRLAVTAPEPGWRAVPARNSELVAFENDIVHKRYADVRERFSVRGLAAERIAHAFAPDINLAKP